MKWRRFVLATAFLFLGLAPLSAQTERRPDLKVANQLLAWIPGQGGALNGSAIVVGDDADHIFLVTAKHVVGDESKIWLCFIDDPCAAGISGISFDSSRAAEDGFVQAEVKEIPIGSTDDEVRIALLRVAKTQKKYFRWTALGHANDNGKAFPCGAPGGRSWHCATELGKFDRDTLTNRLYFDWNTNAMQIRSGFSGGMLLSAKGKIIGLTTYDLGERGTALPILAVLAALAENKVPVRLKFSGGLVDRWIVVGLIGTVATGFFLYQKNEDLKQRKEDLGIDDLPTLTRAQQIEFNRRLQELDSLKDERDRWLVATSASAVATASYSVAFWKERLEERGRLRTIRRRGGSRVGATIAGVYPIKGGGAGLSVLFTF